MRGGSFFWAVEVAGSAAAAAFEDDELEDMVASERKRARGGRGGLLALLLGLLGGWGGRVPTWGGEHGAHTSGRAADRPDLLQQIERRNFMMMPILAQPFCVVIC